MNIIKSLIVLLALFLLIKYTIEKVLKCIKKYKDNCLSKTNTVFASFIVLLSIMCVVIFGDYIYPFERKLNPILIAELEISEEHKLESPGDMFWHGAYEEYGLYAESFHFNPNNKDSILGFEWPDMDFERYSYVITYGQKINTLTYNVWETIDIPIRTGAKVGHMILEDEFTPEKVYVYQIPKMRIDNYDI